MNQNDTQEIIAQSGRSHHPLFIQSPRESPKGDAASIIHSNKANLSYFTSTNNGATNINVSNHFNNNNNITTTNNNKSIVNNTNNNVPILRR